MAVYIGEASFDAVVIEAELLVIDAEEVERRCVQIVTVSWVLLGSVTKRVCASVGGSPTDSATREPCGECTRVVVASLALGCGLSSELGGADD